MVGSTSFALSTGPSAVAIFLLTSWQMPSILAKWLLKMVQEKMLQNYMDPYGVLRSKQVRRSNGGLCQFALACSMMWHHEKVKQECVR